MLLAVSLLTSIAQSRLEALARAATRMRPRRI
jgi:hypothetical protein